MFKNKESDLHMHLNGSFSMQFLESVAIKNKCHDVFIALQKTQREYHEQCQSKTENEYDKKTVDFIWKLFASIHKIIQTLDDIKEGTVDVIGSSKAKYLEIRTTPRRIGNDPWEAYVNAFVAGLIEGNTQFAKEKAARGLLSLDRTQHTEEEAIQIINKVVSEKEKHGLLIGIDISGNPLAERKLTGNTLARVLNYALEKPIGIAIHLGEADTPLEKQEVDTILEVLSSWYEKQTHKEPNPLHGKVRFGHAIFLTNEQCERIRKLQIPLEVCPTCHEKVNWWLKHDAHPVQKNIYSNWADPVVVGTDDSTIFGANAEQENNLVLELFGYPADQKKEQAYLHQAQFRFNA